MLFALAGCAVGEAAPPPSTSGITPPKTWSVDPALAKTAATAAAGDKVTVLGSEAWTAGGRGCYAIWLDLAGGAAPVDAAADALITAMTKELSGLAIHDLQKPVPGETGTLAFGFDKTPYHGRLRAEIQKSGELRALACMWNQREPKSCETGCTALLGAVK